MSGSGVTYYQEELKDLNRLLKHLPDSIPIENEHDFFGFTGGQGHSRRERHRKPGKLGRAGDKECTEREECGRKEHVAGGG
jgi:hypothetical protein